MHWLASSVVVGVTCSIDTALGLSQLLALLEFLNFSSYYYQIITHYSPLFSLKSQHEHEP